MPAPSRNNAPPDAGATKSAYDGGVQSEYERGFEAGRKSWGTIIEQHKAYTAELETSLSQQPAPVAANASAEARLREALDKRCYMVLGPHLSGWRLILGFNTLKEVQDAHETLYTPHASDCSSTPLEIAKANGLVTCLDETGLKITSEIYKACTDLKADACLLGRIGSWGDTLNDDDVLSGLKSYNEMGECFVPDRLHASDCDKQGCMGDASPCDPKDLAELLSKPSVLEPSDRTADVTVDELAMKIAKARIHSRKSTYIARALLDAFTVGRR